MSVVCSTKHRRLLETRRGTNSNAPSVLTTRSAGERAAHESLMVVVLEIMVAVWVLCALGVVVLFGPELRRRETEAPRLQDDRSPVADEPADGRQRTVSA
jgi:hypothetical protein